MVEVETAKLWIIAPTRLRVLRLPRTFNSELFTLVFFVSISGAAGTGKTLLAQAIARETGR